MHRLIDVSMWLDDFTFPGDAPLTVTGPLNFLEGDAREYVYEFATATQTGTHVQGPHYFLEHGARISDIPLERFEGRAHLIDLTKRGTDTTAQDLRDLLGERPVAGDILVLRTGHMDEVVRTGALVADRRPGLSLDAARYLVERGITMVAIDSVGVESRTSRNYEVNVYLCRAGVLILEGLVHLDTVGAGHLWLEAFPLKMRGVEGTPCRAVIKETAPDPGAAEREMAGYGHGGNPR